MRGALRDAVAEEDELRVCPGERGVLVRGRWSCGGEGMARGMGHVVAVAVEQDGEGVTGRNGPCSGCCIM